MIKLRVFLGTAVATALIAGLLAAPASANGNDPRLVIGHGIPSAVVDVCVKNLDGDGGQIEAISKFKFGNVVKTSLPPGNWRFIIRAAKDGNCNGKKLIVAEALLSTGDDLSIIATKTNGVPEVLIFDNTDVDTIGTAAVPTGLSIKHAAMIGKADVYFSVLVNETLQLSAPPTLKGVPKGAALSVEFFPADVKVGVGKTGKDVLRETPFTEVKEGKITHIVAVGGPKNFRYLRYRTPVNLVP